MDEIRFRCAGDVVGLRLEGASDATVEAIRRRVENFATGAPATFHVSLSVKAGSSDQSMKALTPRIAGRTIRSVELECELGDGALRGTIIDSMYAWETAMRAAWTLRLLERGGFLIHAASARVEDGAWIFPGPSGAGKTTLATKAGARRIGDDVAAVAEGRVYATPFYSQTAYDGEASWPLEGIGVLAKGRRALTPLSTAAAVSRLLETVIFFCDDEARAARLLSALSGCAASVPCLELGTELDEPFEEIHGRLSTLA